MSDGTPDPRRPSRSWKRLHAGAPLKSVFSKLPSSAKCADCDWAMTAAGTEDEHLGQLRGQARDHAALAHHRVEIHLHQIVTLEPRHPRTREEAIGDQIP